MLLPFSPDVKVQHAQPKQMTVMGFLVAIPSDTMKFCETDAEIFH